MERKSPAGRSRVIWRVRAFGGDQARDAGGFAGTERSGPGDEAGVLLPVRWGLLVVDPLDGGDEVGGGDLAVDRGAVADPGAQGEGGGAPVSREPIAAGDVGNRDGPLLGGPGQVVAVQGPGEGARDREAIGGVVDGRLQSDDVAAAQ